MEQPTLKSNEGEFFMDDLLEGSVRETSLDYEDEDDDDVPDIQKISSIRPSGKIPRNMSYQSFLTRSQRAHWERKDPPPTREEAAKRKVKFVDNLKIVHEVDCVTEEEKKTYWLTGIDFDRFDADVKVTMFRWNNHKSGVLAFDHDQNSIRGLEPKVEETERSDIRRRWNHMQTILREISEQRLGGRKTLEQIDWNRVREMSIKSSSEDVAKAKAYGLADRNAFEEAWAMDTIPHQQDDGSDGKNKKKKRGLRLLFWKN